MDSSAIINSNGTRTGRDSRVVQCCRRDVGDVTSTGRRGAEPCANKPGYRREVLRFETTSPVDDFSGPQVHLHTDQTPAGFEQTGNPLDVAINGPGFFVVEGPNGTTYTRSGVFQFNGDGQLVSQEGFPVKGLGGPINLPANATSIEIVGDGTLLADGLEVDQLRLVEFADPTKLLRVSSSSFAAPPGVEPVAAQSDVRQGARELANTTAVHEMVQMTTGLRQFEATQRALRSIGDAVALATRPTGR